MTIKQVNENGRRAAKEGRSLADNPHSVVGHPKRFIAWRRGWQAKIAELVPNQLAAFYEEITRAH